MRTQQSSPVDLDRLLADYSNHPIPMNIRAFQFWFLFFLSIAAGDSGAGAADPIGNSIGMRLVPIPAGTFEMGATYGSEEADTDEMPSRTISMPPYVIGAYEITNAQWATVMGKPPSHKGPPDSPVVGVSWHAAVSFCEKLSALR